MEQDRMKIIFTNRTGLQQTNIVFCCLGQEGMFVEDAIYINA